MKRIFLFLLFVKAAASGLGQAPLTVPPPLPAAVTPAPVAVANPVANPMEGGIPAAAAPMSQSIFLDIKDLGSNLSSNANWRSVWGSYSKSTTRARALEMTFRNPAKIAGEYVVEWYFFAVPVRGGKRFLFDRDSKNISLAPGGVEKATIVSDELQSRSVHYAYDYYYYNNYKSGTKPEGWIVTVSTGGKIIRVKTSGAQLDELYKRTDEFAAMTTKQK